jgi:hypothetical protein
VREPPQKNFSWSSAMLNDLAASQHGGGGEPEDAFEALWQIASAQAEAGGSQRNAGADEVASAGASTAPPCSERRRAVTGAVVS